MLKSPITSIIGLLIALCPIVGSFYPELKPICDNIMQQLIGLGFITAADGVKVPSLAPAAVKSFFLLIGTSLLLMSLAACASSAEALKILGKGLATANTIATYTADLPGDYTVNVSHDGAIILSETWTCEDDGAGHVSTCHKR